VPITTRDFDDYNQNTGGAGTIYIPILAGVDNARIIAVKMKWDATLAATITLEGTNFPIKNGDTADVANNSVVAGEWDTIAGFSATAATAAGGATFNIVDRAERRLRLKLVITAGGVLRMRSHGKE
jgi:hypothetical protein